MAASRDCAPPGHFDGWVSKLLLVAASVAAVFFGLEITLRVQRALAVPTAPQPVHEIPGLPAIKFWDLKTPHMDGTYLGIPYRSNAHGFRGPEVTKQKPEGVFRFVVIGDSVTMGQGTEERSIYTTRLETTLNAPGDSSFEVLNLGHAGNNSRASLNRLQELGLDLEPDVVIYGFTVNDLAHHQEYRKTRESRPNDSVLTSPSLAHRWLLARWRNLRSSFYPDPGSYVYELDENYFRNPELWAVFVREMRELKEITSGLGVCTILFVHADITSGEFTSPYPRFYRRVADLGREIGFHVIESREHFLGHEPSALRVAPGDPHPNALGHELLAEALFEGLDAASAVCGGPAHGSTRLQ